MVVKKYDEILKNLENYTIANQDKVTDFNKGGVLRTQYEAFARILESFYIDVRNGFAANLQTMAYSIFDFKKKEGVKATVKVVFKRAKGKNSVVQIQTGTKLLSNGLVFITSEIGVIKENETQSNEVVAIAEKIGLKYNVEANTVTVIDSIVNSEISSVTNPLQATGGTDNETEYQCMERFKLFLNGLQGTNKYGLLAATLGIEGVKSCNIEEHFPPKEDNFNVSLYIDDGSGQKISKELENKILDVINGTDVESNPGKRAGGINVEVLSAERVPINISATVTVSRTDPKKAQFDIQTSLDNLINNLKVGDDVILTTVLIQIRRLSYVTDIKNLMINESINNQIININQVAKLGTVNIEVINK